MEDRKYEKSKSFKIRPCVWFMVTAVIVLFEMNLGLVECLIALYLITNGKTAAFTE